MPPPTRMIDATIRPRENGLRSTAGCTSASIGSVFAARRAGIMTEATVITVPISTALTTLVRPIFAPLPGSATPNAVRASPRAYVRTNPTSSPRSDPRTPITTPS